MIYHILFISTIKIYFILTIKMDQIKILDSK